MYLEPCHVEVGLVVSSDDLLDEVDVRGKVATLAQKGASPAGSAMLRLLLIAVNGEDQIMVLLGGGDATRGEAEAALWAYHI